MKNSNNTIGNRTRDLTTLGAMHHVTKILVVFQLQMHSRSKYKTWVTTTFSTPNVLQHPYLIFVMALFPEEIYEV